MKYYILIFLLFFLSDLFGRNYYFSTASGNDGRSATDAQNPSTPWKTLDKLNSIFTQLVPGDSVFFMRGEIFAGSIKVVKSGAEGKPIVFTAYGKGNKPVISGFTILSKWTGTENKIFECTASFLPSVNVLLINGSPKAIGRYPNASAVNSGYLKYESAVSNVKIIDNELPASPDWTNGEVVIRKNRWVVDRNFITLHKGDTINYTSGSHYSADINYGYFIQNHPKTLDQDGEWYYDRSNKKLGIFSDKDPASAIIKASTKDTLVTLSNQQYIEFNNVAFEGANQNAIDIKGCSYISIYNCDIKFTGANAVNALNSSNVYVENCFIYYANNIALNVGNCSYTNIKNNLIKCTGVFAGMGQGDSGSYEAVMIDGSNNFVEFNEIDSTGYIPLTFSGNTISIRNNFINYFAFVKDDGGGIYTYNGFAVPKINSNRKIIDNIILNGMGATAGTPDTINKRASGIYMDDKVSNVQIANNTVAKCGLYGIFVHNANGISLTGNTVFDNTSQLGLVHDKVAPNDPIKNIWMVNNILVSKNTNSAVAEYKTIANDLKAFGVFDSNYYCRPADDNLVFNLAYVNNNVNVSQQTDLDGWKVMSLLDKNSKKSPVKIAPYQVNKLNGSNKFVNGSFNSNISGLYAWSAAGNCVASWNSTALDNGALQISFSKITGATNPASVVIGVGDVVANKTYVLRFSMKGADDHQTIQGYLRKSVADYNDLSERKNFLIKAQRTENEIVFTAASTQSKASIVFDILEQKNPVYIDNIQLYQADVTTNDLDKFIRFEYNPGKTKKTISLDGTYTDVKNKSFSNSITLNPFSSIILLKKQPEITFKKNTPAINSLVTSNKKKTGVADQKYANNVKLVIASSDR